MNRSDQINNSDSVIQNNDTLALGFLTWLDTLERLDTLLLEARHLQKNILYFLGEPILYRPLDEEEKFIWLNNSKVDMKQELEKIYEDIDKFVKLYPSLSVSEDGSEDKITKAVSDAIKRADWHDEQRSQYSNLCAIQKIKRNILQDKLLLCYHGIKTFEVSSREKDVEIKTNELSRFILIRCLILARARAYVDRLGDHQDIFINNQDVGLLHPRPSARR